MTVLLQKCPFCKVTKTLAEFNKGPRPNGVSTYCKQCAYIRHVCRTYKISEKAYRAMVEEAGGVCECCGKIPTRLVVDHDHETGAVRGLICDRCNQFLGCIESTPSIYQQASKYLARNHKE